MGIWTPVNVKMTVDGRLKESFPMTEADDDWIRAGRLKARKEAGDEEAAKELDEMQHAFLFKEVEE